MIVQTRERQYAVLQVLRRTQNEEVSVCQDLREETGGLYTLARFKDPALNRYLLPMLARQRSNPAFTDFLDLFSQNGELYACFRYSQAPTLAQRLEGDGLSLRERLEVGRSLLERMALLDMPPALQFEALREHNITLDESMSVSFNYVLESMTACFNVDIGFICVRVEEVLRALFEPELSAQSVPELEEYLHQLGQTRFKSYLELYGGFDPVYQAMKERLEGERVEPRTWLFRLWDKIKGLTKLARPLLAGLVVVAAFCYLLYTLLQPPVPKTTPVLFDRIGTVELRDGVQAETGTETETEPGAEVP